MSSFAPAYFDVLPVHPQPQPLESLTSYLTRLTEANRLGSLSQLFRLCFPTERSKLTLHTGDYPPPSFGTLPILAQCSEPCLYATTLYHLSKKFNRLCQPRTLALFLSDSLGQGLRYCPACLAERPYYPLVWRFLYLEGCPEHSCRLLDRCLSCGQAIPLWVTCPKLGVCPACGGDLRRRQAPRLTDNQQQRVQSQYQDLVFLVSPHPCEALGQQLPKVIGANFTRWRQFRQLKASAAALYLKQSESIIAFLEEGPEHRGIKFCWYIQYADFLKIGLHDLFNLPVLPEISLSREEKLLDKIKEAMTILAERGQPLTQAAICQMVGVSTNIFNTHPNLHACWVSAAAHQKQQRLEPLAQSVRQTIAQLQQQGQPVTQQAVTQQLGLYGGQISRCPKLRSAFEEAIGHPIKPSVRPKGRNQSHLDRIRAKQERETALLPQVQAAIEQLQTQGRPVTRVAVRAMVGCPLTTMNSYPQVNALLQAHTLKRSRQDEAALISKVYAAITDLQADGLPITKAAIAKRIGMAPTTLEHYPQVKTVLFEEVMLKTQDHHLQYFQRREDELVHQVQQAIDLLVSQQPHLTQIAVCKIVQMSSVNLKRYPRVRLLLAQHGLTRVPG